MLLVAISVNAQEQKSTKAKVNNTQRRIQIKNFSSAYVEPRNVEILLPPNYSRKKKYSVIYMHDGQNVFDTKASFSGKSWQTDKVLDSLYTDKAIIEAIIVAPWNTTRRFREYMPQKPDVAVDSAIRNNADKYKDEALKGLESDQYLKFLVKELKPFIDRRFSTKFGPEGTFIMGSSMGGLISLYAICEYPEVFGGAACLSTHWVALNGVFLKYIQDKLPDPSKHKIYFDHGTVALDSLYAPYQLQVDQLMRKQGYLIHQNFVSLEIKGASHTEQDWYNRLHIPLQFLLSKDAHKTILNNQIIK